MNNALPIALLVGVILLKYTLGQIVTSRPGRRISVRNRGAWREALSDPLSMSIALATLLPWQSWYTVPHRVLTY
jgi:hypothetical protein